MFGQGWLLLAYDPWIFSFLAFLSVGRLVLLRFFLGFTGHRCRLSVSPAPSPGLLDAGYRSLAQASFPRSGILAVSFLAYF